MSEPEPRDPQATDASAKKAWVEPDLAAYPMSEAEGPGQPFGGRDLGSSIS